jgi:hypothetical protein
MMNFQEILVEASSGLRARAITLTTATLDAARLRARDAAKRADTIRHSVVTLSDAGRALSKVARRHAARFVAQNSAIAVAAGKDVGALARSTYATLSNRKAGDRSARAMRKVRTARKRSASKAN